MKNRFGKLADQCYDWCGERWLVGSLLYISIIWGVSSFPLLIDTFIAWVSGESVPGILFGYIDYRWTLLYASAFSAPFVFYFLGKICDSIRNDKNRFRWGDFIAAIVCIAVLLFSIIGYASKLSENYKTIVLGYIFYVVSMYPWIHVILQKRRPVLDYDEEDSKSSSKFAKSVKR